LASFQVKVKARQLNTATARRLTCCCKLVELLFRDGATAARRRRWT